MRIFNFKRKNKKRIRSPEQKRTIEQANIRHKKRIDNLTTEVDVLVNKLAEIERDIEMPKSVKSKSSDLIIRRLVLIKYEVGVREDLISWL